MWPPTDEALTDRGTNSLVELFVKAYLFGDVTHDPSLPPLETLTGELTARDIAFTLSLVPYFELRRKESREAGKSSSVTMYTQMLKHYRKTVLANH
ncbi:hypothetical protein J4208_05975 [Candidatus Woesearchaeota archaeon]|nr:hypothetical protein [Candidatus Woesearchaeota archaeon]